MPTSDKESGLSAALKAALAAEPPEPKRRHGAIRAAVIAHFDDLMALRAKGWSDASIAEIFKVEGLNASTGTIKTYLNAERAARHGPSRPARRRLRNTAKATAASPVAAPATGKARPSETAARSAPTGDAGRNPTTHKLNEDV